MEMEKHNTSRQTGKRGDAITEYDALLWHGMVEFATVYGKDDIRFTMKDGTEIRAQGKLPING